LKDKRAPSVGQGHDEFSGGEPDARAVYVLADDDESTCGHVKTSGCAASRKGHAQKMYYEAKAMTNAIKN
jgi:hypothetical protein